MKAALVSVLFIALQQTTSTPDLTRYFVGVNGTFVLLNGKTGEHVRYNEQRAAERFAPCSTFKIPHTAILLESGVAPDPEYVVTYDPSFTQPSLWAREFTLRTAFRFSAAWYYQVLARRAGMGIEQQFIHHFDYGNKDVHGGLDEMGNPFWIDGVASYFCQ